MATGVRVSAATDVVVVRLFEPRAELRIGHMEVGLAVPAGGIVCPGIAMTKTSDPASVSPGHPFAWNIEVSNPNDCLLQDVKVTDMPAASAGVDWNAITSLPRSRRSFTGNSLEFDALPAIDTGGTAALQINAEIGPGSGPGTITNRAVAVGACSDAPLTGSAETTTRVGAGLLPGLPAPGTGLGRQGQSSNGGGASDAGSGEQAQGAEAIGIGPTAAATRSAAARTTRTATQAAAATGAPGTTSSAGSSTAVGTLARSGVSVGPLVGQALSLLGLGLFARRRARRRP
jgi:hypothetical protein